jgi:hypothetical protein
MAKIKSTFLEQARGKPVQKPPFSAKTRKLTPDVPFFERLESWCDRNKLKIFWAAMILTLLFGILLFDIRFTVAGDDSDYVIKASDFIRHFIYPGFEGP